MGSVKRKQTVNLFYTSIKQRQRNQHRTHTWHVCRCLDEGSEGSDRSSDSYLEAEESNRIDDIVFPVGSRGWQDRQKVVDPQREEEQETQKVAPDVHGLIGQDENAAVQKKPRRSFRKLQIA